MAPPWSIRFQAQSTINSIKGQWNWMLPGSLNLKKIAAERLVQELKIREVVKKAQLHPMKF